ncbi:hypothetical protein [Jannaschia sp. R86511]|uniref:hypothetical protein n=1 Tax=Jannaschia sp. R86511 TaxID=3093853 RepID=UPI0036D2419A
MWHTLAIHAAASLPWGKIIAVVIGVQLAIAGLATLLVLSVTVETEQTDTRGDCTVIVNPTGLDVEGLDDTQFAHAATIVQVGRQRALPDQAIRVALAVAAQESKFRNYANDGTGDLRPDQRGVSRSLAYPHDAVGVTTAPSTCSSSSTPGGEPSTSSWTPSTPPESSTTPSSRSPAGSSCR